MKLPTPEDAARVARLLAASEEIAEKLGIAIMRERMAPMGGLCHIKGQWRLYLNQGADPEEQLAIFVRALTRFDLSDHYILPALRTEIERMAAENSSHV
ncbi:MAG: hypothetical protein NTX50_05220 [Candidatus Sumerlaeota bacterium]|nr:hypothetical protein [Candidatus Sumerlaeota bacterium]